MKDKLKGKDVNLFEEWSFSSKNYIIFGIGLVMIILGYFVMAMGSVNSFQSLTLAPIMLFIGYLIIIPLALIYRDKSNQSGNVNSHN
tara:strand:+ start:860 stop:1120 length:261 start_codon:yes stop_codon:yes gene_type:complete